MEVEKEGKGEEVGEGTPRALGSIEFLTQETDLSGTALIDAHIGSNEMSHLVMLWTVQHRWKSMVRFTFNFYRHWAQLLLRQTGDPPVTILS